MKSKLMIFNNEVIPVLCDSNNFCTTLQDNLKLDNSEEYALTLTEYFLNNIQKNKDTNETFYLGMNRSKVDLNDKRLLYRNSTEDCLKPIDREKLSDDGEVFLELQEVKPNILCLKSET